MSFKLRLQLGSGPPRWTESATGEAIKIKASKKIAFRPAKELKEADRSAELARTGHESEVDDGLLSAEVADPVAASQNSRSAIHFNAAASVGNLRRHR